VRQSLAFARHVQEKTNVAQDSSKIHVSRSGSFVRRLSKSLNHTVSKKSLLFLLMLKLFLLYAVLASQIGTFRIYLAANSTYESPS